MTSSKTLPFAIIAGLILITAFAWKFLANSEGQTTVKQNKTEAIVANSSKSTTKPVTNSEEITVVSYTDDEEENTAEPTQEELAEIALRSQYFMKFSMRYSTPETAIAGLKALREDGDSAKASALIKYIDESFPNTVIPSELLD